MAPYDRNSGSNKTGQAALPHKNIHLSYKENYIDPETSITPIEKSIYSTIRSSKFDILNYDIG